MFEQVPLPAGNSLAVRQVQVDESESWVKIEVVSTQSGGRCPLCGQRSTSVHTKYWRRLGDLPWCGLRVELHLQVHKYFCKVPTCQRRIFTERLPEVTRPHGRQTRKVRQIYLQPQRAQCRHLQACKCTTADLLIKAINTYQHPASFK